MKVSVIIPTYRPTDYLRRAIESVVAQDICEMEILVVDDGSPPEFRNFLRALAEAFPVRLIRRESNGGPAAAYNTGLQHATGRYIAFLEHDDIFLPEKLRCQISALERHPEWGMCYVGGVILNDAGTFVKKLPLRCFEGQQAFEQLWQGNFIPSMSSVVMRWQCLEEVGCLDESFSIAHDYDLWFRVAMSQWKIGSIADWLVGVRRHQSNFSALNESKGIEETIKVLEKALTACPDRWQWAKCHYARCWYRLGKSYYRKKQWREAGECFLRAFTINRFLLKALGRWILARWRQRE